MPRKLREELAGGIHHVWARGNNRQAIFLDDDDRRLYLTLLARVIGRTRWRLLGYCLMGNHVHLLVETPEPNLGRGMQRLHGVFAQTVNARHESVGHVFQGRFDNKLQRTDEQLWTAARYIARNPVEAGLCEAAAQWRWSSHRGVLDGTAPPWVDRNRLLSFFGTMGGDPRSVYKDLVDG
jgi:REP element-mobilizing transposase RayT